MFHTVTVSAIPYSSVGSAYPPPSGYLEGREHMIPHSPASVLTVRTENEINNVLQSSRPESPQTAKEWEWLVETAIEARRRGEKLPVGASTAYVAAWIALDRHPEFAKPPPYRPPHPSLPPFVRQHRYPPSYTEAPSDPEAPSYTEATSDPEAPSETEAPSSCLRGLISTYGPWDT
ncbi:hypothetical protein BC835DRAFT_1420258 [Cytidiella melzeri]|nr:hypothetical protein BC835DRAFT_1420258 [Cytidiella melzeri]